MSFFTKLENPTVSLQGISDLKKQLDNKIKLWNHYPILKWVIRGDEVLIDILIRDSEKRRVFFGYVDDVAYNLQKGYYEDVARVLPNSGKIRCSKIEVLD
jgi:hypothetical protein